MFVFWSISEHSLFFFWKFFEKCVRVYVCVNAWICMFIRLTYFWNSKINENNERINPKIPKFQNLLHNGETTLSKTKYLNFNSKHEKNKKKCHPT